MDKPVLYSQLVERNGQATLNIFHRQFGLHYSLTVFDNDDSGFTTSVDSILTDEINDEVIDQNTLEVG